MEGITYRIDNTCAGVKELLSKAIDSNVRAGRENYPIKVIWDQDVLTIKDSGNGYTHQEVKELSKIPFTVGQLCILSLNESYTFSTCVEGRKDTYRIHRDSIEYNLESSEPTEEIGNSISFKVVRDVVESSRFEKVIEVNTRLAPCPCEISLPKLQPADLDQARQSFIIYKEGNVAIRKSGNSGGINMNLSVNVGNTHYRISEDLCNKINASVNDKTYFNSRKLSYCLKVEASYLMSAESDNLVLLVDRSEIELSESEQSIRFSSQNLATIEKYLCQASNYLLKKFAGDTDSWEEVIEKVNEAETLKGNIKDLLLISKALKYKGYPVTSSISAILFKPPLNVTSEDIKCIPDTMLINIKESYSSITPLYWYNGKKVTRIEEVPILNRLSVWSILPSFNPGKEVSRNLMSALTTSNNVNNLCIPVDEIIDHNWIVYKTENDVTFPTPKLLKKYNFDLGEEYLVYRYKDEKELTWLYFFNKLGLLKSFHDLKEVSTKAKPPQKYKSLEDVEDPYHIFFRRRLNPEPERSDLDLEDTSIVLCTETNNYESQGFVGNRSSIKIGVERYRAALNEAFGYPENHTFIATSIVSQDKRVPLSTLEHVENLIRTKTKVNPIKAEEVLLELDFLYRTQIADKTGVSVTDVSFMPNIEGSPLIKEDRGKIRKTLDILSEFTPEILENKQLKDFVLRKDISTIKLLSEYRSLVLENYIHLEDDESTDCFNWYLTRIAPSLDKDVLKSFNIVSKECDVTGELINLIKHFGALYHA